MPEYNPPSTHYCEINAFTSPSDNFKLIGPNGHNFKRLTNLLGVQYMWWNIERNVIEIWGPYSKMSSSQKYMSKYMTRFHEKYCKGKQELNVTLDTQPAKRLKVSQE